MRKRILLFLIFFIIVFLVIFSLMNGAVKTSLKDITDVFFNGSANTPDYIRTIIMDIRLPRIIMAL
nr:iron chelate uptake ABC transporter family permease subunit [Petrotogaceae bacterium]